MLHTRFKAESPVLKVGSSHGTQPKVTGLSALFRKPNLDKPAACRAPTFHYDQRLTRNSLARFRSRQIHRAASGPARRKHPFLANAGLRPRGRLPFFPSLLSGSDSRF